MKKFLKILCAVILVVIAVYFLFFARPKINSDNIATYDCDVQSLNMNTEIHISGDTGKSYVVKGNLFKFIEDPLTMYESGNKVGYAGDDYYFVSQDNHPIYIGDEVTAIMVSKFSLFGGNKYTIYDSEFNEIGKMSVNLLNSSGKIKDANGKIIASYSSQFFLNDYTVKIDENNTVMDDETILMLFVSHYSDYKADQKSSKKSNSNN